MSLNAIVVGSTGATGRGLVTILAADPRFVKVVAVVRREIDLHSTFIKVQEEHLSKIVPLVVDFDHLDTKDFEGFDIGFTALGLYTLSSLTEEKWRATEFDINLRIAKMLKDAGTERFCYLSGSGATRDNPETSRQMFVRVKGSLEVALSEIGFERFTAARSGGILGRKEVGVAPAYPGIEWAVEWIKYTPLGLSAINLGAAMVECMIMEEKPPLFFEPSALNQLSRQYYEGLSL